MAATTASPICVVQALPPKSGRKLWLGNQIFLAWSTNAAA